MATSSMTQDLQEQEQFSGLPIAKELGARYKILRQIGLGGCGVVYLAEDKFEQRQVAIKVARWDSSVDVKKRMHRLWMNEVRSAGQIKHPFVVDTYEAGLVEGGEYIVMEYVDGGTLEPFTTPEQLLPVERVVDIIFKVCKALEYVHSLDILHRDIKPSNILLGQDGVIKVSDFGACYQANSADTQVLDVGTLTYVPPEQFQDASPTGQFDIYATGVIAYQMLTGHSPYTGSSYESLIYQKLYVDPAPISDWRKNIPEKLTQVILRAIARDPEIRYKDWKELSAELEAAMPAEDVERPKEIVNDSSKYASLSKLKFFREFSQPEIWETIQISSWIRYLADEEVFSEGDPGTSIYVIILGEAGVFKNKVHLNEMRAGRCFGEMAYIDDTVQLRSASVVASTMMVVLCINGERLRQSSAGLQARFANALLRAMVDKITHADSRYLAMADEMTLSRPI